VARKLTEAWPRALAKGIEFAENCRCDHGCPNCIEPAKPYDIGKVEGINLGRHLLKVVRDGPDSEFRNSQLVPIVR